ncbi:MAG: type II toxin-antitoxin system HicA family toxin [Candidatus Magasanikbacteria bacterium]|jgi:predicted RNA binding protein YcfA (HicA-like mRNA interferase family)
MVSFSQLPNLKAKQLIHILEKIGFEVARQKGSHVILIHEKSKLRTVVPIHSGETIKKSLLMEIVKQVGLSVEDFLELL